MIVIKKNDLVEVKFSGYSNGALFDSNIEKDIKTLNPKESERETIVIVGQGMLVPGLDKAIEGKEVGKEYAVTFGFADGFGERKKDMVKMLPLKIFKDKNVDPEPGMSFALDDKLARVITVSGSRVTVDFNNPLAGKDLNYKFKVVRKIDDEKEKCTFLLETMFRFKPEFEIKDNKVVINAAKNLEMFVNTFNDKFKEIIGKDLAFEEKKDNLKENSGQKK